MKMEKRMSWSKIFKLNNRVFRLFYKRYPQVILSWLINVVWRALVPYVGIFLSALIIDELAGNHPLRKNAGYGLCKICVAVAGDCYGGLRPMRHWDPPY